MANYHLEVQPVSRGKGQSLTRRASYISGRPLHDACLDKYYYHARDDVLYAQVLLPEGAPPEFRDLNRLCSAVEGAERRWDARTAKSLTGSLPNELSLPEWIPIVETFVRENFTDRGLCAIAAIHQGKNPRCPQQDNPHVHILVSTRAVGVEGFAPRKDRTLDRKDSLRCWREQWAQAQNRAYARSGLSVRVSHESLERQGIDREPVNHLSRMDWQRERQGERTRSGDKRREIQRRNKRRLEQERGLNRAR